MTKEECTLEAEVLINLDPGSTPFTYSKRLQE